MLTRRRVGAVSHVDEDESIAYLYGYGILLGEFCPKSCKSVPRPAGYMAAVRPVNAVSPLIKLDGGKYVWGCECWWENEESVKKRMKKYKKVVKLDINKEREKATKINFYAGGGQ